jgi:hypothetical protein
LRLDEQKLDRLSINAVLLVGDAGSPSFLYLARKCRAGFAAFVLVDICVVNYLALSELWGPCRHHKTRFSQQHFEFCSPLFFCMAFWIFLLCMQQIPANLARDTQTSI